MKKTFEPVPDVEALRYKGTPEKPDIKIFVSHRIDQDSETVDNPLYIPVRCGAVYDERENVTILGDDTGDNISEKCTEWGDLTVQYWAWKNVKADYVGFYKHNQYLYINGTNDSTTDQSEMYHALRDEKNIVSILETNDLIIAPTLTIDKEVREYILDDIYHWDQGVLKNLLQVIQYKYPDILRYANDYFLSNELQKHSVWIANRKIADKFFYFEFSVLSSLERRIDMNNAGEERKKVFLEIVPHLLRIYANYLQKRKKVKVYNADSIDVKQKKECSFIQPAFEKDNIAVVFSCSNAFAPYLGVTLQSMMDKISSGNNYDIIVLERTISVGEKEAMLSICSDKKNVSLRFFNTEDVVSDVHFYVPTSDLSEETYYTILAPWILTNYDKALVLDCDIIINADLAELFAYDINGYYLAAVKEIVYLGFLNNPILNNENDVVNYTVEKLNMKNPYDYFNAGVLLLNLDKFRQNYTMQKLLSMVENEKYRIVEQDLLNAICSEQALFLDYSWNFMACLTDPSLMPYNASLSDTTIPNLRLAPEKEIKLYRAASDSPKIYHYLTKMKPWKYPYLKYANIWWSVAKKTPYYERFLYELTCNQIKELKQCIANGQFTSTPDNRSGARIIADVLLPKETKRRKVAKRLIPKGTRRWAVLKQIYYVFSPKYRRSMKDDITYKI